MKRWSLAAVVALLMAAAAVVAAQTPVVWSLERENTKPLKPGSSFTMLVKAEIEFGWHLYAINQPPGGPIATEVNLVAAPPFASGGSLETEEPIEGFDPNFNLVTEYYDDHTVFRVPVRITPTAKDGQYPLTIIVRYQSCNDTLCIPPRSQALKTALIVGNPVATPTPVPMSPESRVQGPESVQSAGSTVQGPASGPQGPASKVQGLPAVARSVEVGSGSRVPVPDLAAADTATTLGAYMGLAALMGALSLLTPCVFPMVPITVSYFTRSSQRTRRDATAHALVYGLGIVLTFTALGFALALMFGASGLNRFAANPWLNIAIAALFITFAFSLFGVYEVMLPSRVVTAASKASSGTGYASTLLMGLAFTLTSFTCTAPFLGTLLVVAAQGDWQWPMAGMLAFSSVFALPFVVLALAPRLLASLPRAGMWLMGVKATMGLLELAAAMKFISNVDLVWGWGIFTRDVVLGTWIVIAMTMAAYLAGLVRLGHAPKMGRPGPGRLAAAAAAVVLGIWLGTGVAGRRLGELEAFLPPADAAHLAQGGELSWIVNDFDGALKQAAAADQRILVDFTGYTCTNCRWMEANMFPRPDVAREMSRFVRVRLYTDGQGDQFERLQEMEEQMLGTVALPYYAVLTPDGQPIVAFGGLTRDADRFLRFLQRGLTDAVPDK
jgi:thiol:disulfide interchange protein DsbD